MQQSRCRCFPQGASPVGGTQLPEAAGHPWLLARSLWPDLLAFAQEKTLRDFLNENSSEILYVKSIRLLF
jgi:hypothetical protein